MDKKLEIWVQSTTESVVGQTTGVAVHDGRLGVLRAVLVGCGAPLRHCAIERFLQKMRRVMWMRMCDIQAVCTCWPKRTNNVSARVSIERMLKHW